jgi:hypothetical protein
VLDLAHDPCPACRNPRPVRYLAEHLLCAPCTSEVTGPGRPAPLRPTQEVAA